MFGPIRRKIKRYNYNNPYKHRMLFLGLEAGLVVIEIALFAAVCFAGYSLLVKLTSVDQFSSASLSQPTDSAASIVAHQSIADKIVNQPTDTLLNGSDKVASANVDGPDPAARTASTAESDTAAIASAPLLPELMDTATMPAGSDPALIRAPLPDSVAKAPLPTPLEPVATEPPTSNKEVRSSGRLMKKEALSWLHEQNADQYIIQFASSGNETDVVGFTDEFMPNSAVIYPFKLGSSDKTVFGAASKTVYDSQEAASVALKEMPENVKQYDPWIRPVSELQRIIPGQE